jgi:hypothetical protein
MVMPDEISKHIHDFIRPSQERFVVSTEDNDKYYKPCEKYFPIHQEDKANKYFDTMIEKQEHGELYKVRFDKERYVKSMKCWCSNTLTLGFIREQCHCCEADMFWSYETSEFEDVDWGDGVCMDCRKFVCHNCSHGTHSELLCEHCYVEEEDEEED